MAIDLQEINSLIEDPANVSLPIKVGAILALFGLVVFAGYKFIIVDEIAVHEQVVAKEAGLRQTFEKKQARANQLPALRAQLAEMQTSFAALKRQLPSDTEIPGLILDISEKGLTNGLEIDLFEPKPEIHKEFFAEKPITLKAKGTYNELAGFVSDLSGLPRIVTINNIHLTPEKTSNTKGKKKNHGSSRIILEATIKTYRYLNEDDEENEG
jgi:type IV pilus assembly protein PilO